MINLSALRTALAKIAAQGDSTLSSIGISAYTHSHGGVSSPAPANATYLVTTADATLSAEVAVGATPGGELGGTWGTPTVDATHSGSSHAATQAAAEATAAAALGAPHHTVRFAAGVPAGAPATTELPIAFDSTAVTGGVYYWTGAAWVKGGTI